MPYQRKYMKTGCLIALPYLSPYLYFYCSRLNVIKCWYQLWKTISSITLTLFRNTGKLNDFLHVICHIRLNWHKFEQWKIVTFCFVTQAAVFMIIERTWREPLLRKIHTAKVKPGNKFSTTCGWFASLLNCRTLQNATGEIFLTINLESRTRTLRDPKLLKHWVHTFIHKGRNDILPYAPLETEQRYSLQTGSAATPSSA